MTVVASVIGIFAATTTTAAMNPQQASAVVKCSYQQYQRFDAFINCTQKDTPFILPFP
jgi:uncharacterized protein with PQ loop repeat